MGSSLALSPDNTFVVLTAYGYGTDTGVYHEDNFFLVKYNLTTKTYSRIDIGRFKIDFVSNDNTKVVVDDQDEGSKYVVTIATGEKELVEPNTWNIVYGMHASTSDRYIKVWRGSGMGMYDVNSGVLYTAIDGATLGGSFRGLGSGAQFSADDSKVYFTASSDYYTNYASTFEVMSTPADFGGTDDDPESLFVLGPEYDTYLFLMIYR